MIAANHGNWSVSVLLYYIKFFMYFSAIRSAIHIYGKHQQLTQCTKGTSHCIFAVR